MKTYGQYCPIAKAAEILGDRWTMLIIRELLFGPLGFNEIARGLPGISRSILSQRLRYLERRGIVARVPGSTGGWAAAYALTPVGDQLGEAVKVLGNWAARWVVEDPSQAELDPDLLMLWISRHMDMSAIPGRRTVVEFRFDDGSTRPSWLVFEKAGEVSVCHEDPQLDERRYVYVRASTQALYEVYSGRASLRDALDDGRVRLAGQAALVRAFTRWFTWSSFAPATRAGLEASRAG
jgi:DNA-binding HxlR family transcriptional regulator